jgi:hypothetical protein
MELRYNSGCFIGRLTSPEVFPLSPLGERGPTGRVRASFPAERSDGYFPEGGKVTGVTHRRERRPLPALPGHPCRPSGGGENKRLRFVFSLHFYSAVSNLENTQIKSIVITNATKQSMEPHGLPHRCAPRNDAIWSGLRIRHICVYKITD